MATIGPEMRRSRAWKLPALRISLGFQWHSKQPPAAGADPLGLSKRAKGLTGLGTMLLRARRVQESGLFGALEPVSGLE